MEIYCREKGIPMPEKNRGEESLAKMRREREEENNNVPPVNNMPPQNVPPQWNNMPPQNVPPQENGGNKPAEAENKGSRDFSEMLKNRSYHEKNTDDDNGNTSGGN